MGQVRIIARASPPLTCRASRICLEHTHAGRRTNVASSMGSGCRAVYALKREGSWQLDYLCMMLTTLEWGPH